MLKTPSPIWAAPALLALAFVFVLALFPDARLLKPGQMTSEKITLLFLVVSFALALFPPFARRLIEDRDAASWALLVAGVVLFHIADRAGPRAGEGFGLGWALTPDDPLAVSYATRAVVVGALLSFPLWLRTGAPESGMLGGLLLLGVLGAGSFILLGRFYPVGVTETLDPTSLGTLALQILAYGCVALCARAATFFPAARKLLFVIMPIVLLIIWARHQFAPIAAPVETDQ